MIKTNKSKVTEAFILLFVWHIYTVWVHSYNSGGVHFLKNQLAAAKLRYHSINTP